MVSSLLSILILSTSVTAVLWSAGAIYFDAFGGSVKGRVAAIAWILFWAAAGLVLTPAWKPLLLLLAAFCGVLWWWRSQLPSQERNWDPHFAQLARLELDGDQITLTNVRYSEYLARGESRPRYETRQYRLSELRGVDVIICTWGSPWMSHPMVVFDFGSDGRLCISIEVRYRVGQQYSLLRSLYRQQELIYVACDERDAILRRTQWLGGQELYLYRLWTEPVGLRQFFLAYANRINALAQAPRWYHGLTTNCTTSVYAQGRGQIRWGWRMLLNGSLDRLLYERGLLDQRLPFEELKRSSRINEIANRAPDAGFGDYVRRELPAYRTMTPLDHELVETHDDDRREGSAAEVTSGR